MEKYSKPEEEAAPELREILSKRKVFLKRSVCLACYLVVCLSVCLSGWLVSEGMIIETHFQSYHMYLKWDSVYILINQSMFPPSRKWNSVSLPINQCSLLPGNGIAYLYQSINAPSFQEME